LLVLLAAAGTLSIAQTSVSLATATSPSAGQPGIQTISVTGSGFPTGTIAPANVLVSLQPAAGGAAVTTVPSAVATVTGSSRRVTFQIPTDISVSTPTNYIVSVSGTTSAGVSFATGKPSTLVVNPPPAIASLTPGVVLPGVPASISIATTYTNFVQGATVASFGPGIAVGGAAEGAFGPVTVTSPTTATANLSVSATTSGFHRVAVRTGVQEAAIDTAFSVTSPTPPPNQPPWANAGPNQTITLPAGATLNGVVTDDGLPAGAAVTSTWSRFSGPGAVNFANAASPATTATFDQAGTYVLRLTANDTQLTVFSDVTVTVNAAAPTNQTPVVNAGSNQTITLPAGATLNGVVTDDGLPAGAAVTSTWSRFSGPGTVTFANAASPTTTATFDQAGTYVLRLTANDTLLTAFSDVTVTVNPAAPTNQPPVVNAGSNQTITLPAGATLNGVVTDDGLPAGAAVTSTWSRFSGPGAVAFANAASPATTATFDQAGTYVLRLTASDTQSSAFSDVTIVVSLASPTNQPPVARTGGPYAGTTGQPIAFNGAASTDADGDALSYLWNFGDDSTATGTAPSHTYTAADQYSVTLTVSDGKGGTHSATVAVPVTQANRQPVANAGGPYTGDAASPIAFSGLASTDPDHDALTYAWDFGDSGSSSGSTPTHTFTTSGTFTITLTVSDGHGGSGQTTTSAVVGAAADRAPPVVTVNAATQALPGAQVLVTAAATDNVGVASVTFEIDGANPTQAFSAPFQRTVTIPALASPGATITVKATARDGAGNAGINQAIITIVAAPDSTPPTVAIALPPQASPGAIVRLSATAADTSGVQSVVFSTGGQPFGTDDTPPYEASFVVPPATTPGTSLTITAHAVDFAGNPADSTGELSIVATPDTTPPTVALTSPASAREGGLVHLSATASDNVKVAAVTFLVGDVAIATRLDPPYEADFVVPSTRHAGAVLQVRALAIDSSNLEATSDKQVRIVEATAVGTGVVVGEVYDDSTSLPLAGVTVALAGNDDAGTPYNVVTTTDARGQYFLAAGSGQGTLRIAKAGWSRVERPVTIADQEAVEPLDARLTPVSGGAQPIAAVIGGRLTGGNATLTLQGSALSADVSLNLVAIGPQGLAGLLPAGWSPVGAIDLLPHGVDFANPQDVALANNGQLPIGTPLVLAAWDESASAWRAVQLAPIAGDGSRLTGAVPSTGQYAWLLADSVPAAPAPASAGALVAGVPLLAVPNPATADVTPEPRILFYKPGVTSKVGAVLQAGAPMPSGTPLRTQIAETYRFTSGAEIHPLPFSEDLVFYQSPGPASRTSASFAVTPSLTFDPLGLQQGVITVELRAPAAASQHAVIGPTGGTASAPTGEQVTIPAGALAAAATVNVDGLPADGAGLSMPPELAFVGGATINFSGAGLQNLATLSVPRRTQIDDSGLLVLIRVVELQGATRLLLVGRGRIVGTRIVSDPAFAGLATALDGVSGSGRYLFARVTTPTGFVTGTVAGTQGSPFPGALVSANGWPTVSLSAAAGPSTPLAAGRYVALAKVGPVTITARDLSTLEAGTAQGTIGAPDAVLPLDLRLAAQTPTVTTVAPAEGATNVALSSAIVATFSEPIDPASLTGPGGGNVLVTAANGSVVSGALSLSAGNTKATFRPAALLAANTAYTITISNGFRNLGGHATPAPVVSHFTSLDTTPPPPPAAGSIAATMPDAAGMTTVVGSQGTAGVHDTVSIVNLTRKTSTPALVDANGGFRATFAAGRGDKLQVAITDANGNQTVAVLPAFTRTNGDGSIATVVGSEGGHVNGPNGSAVDVPAGALPDGSVVTIKFIDEVSFPVKLTAAQKQFFEFTGGLQIDFGGATPSAYVNVSLPATANDTRSDRWIVGQVMMVAGRQIFNVADTAHVINGRITTSSPPCPGVQAAAAYGFVKTAKRFAGVAVGYGRFGAASFDPYNTSILSWTQPALGAISPFQVVATASPVDVCMPILSGRVTVSPNSQRLVIAADQFTPVDREIVVRNRTLLRTFHYPRNVAEFRFLVSGTADDTYVVSVVSGSNQQQVTPEISDGPAGFVNVRLDMDTLTSVVTEVVVRNISKNPVIESHFPQSTAAVKIAVAGGVDDGFDVSVVDVNENERPVVFTVESPNGGGNLVAKALPVTIDPGTDVFLERRDGHNPATVLSRQQIPPADIQFGGFTYTFNGDAENDTFRVEVVYQDGRPSDAIGIPNVAFTVSDAATGRVIRTFNALVPPPDEPFNLGSVSGDMQWPLLTGSPSFLNNFDPSSPLVFTFSEGIDRNSAKSHFLLFDDQHRLVPGEVRLSNENRTLTFVPNAALRMGAHYTLEMTLLADGAGNYMGTTVINITTFTPKQAVPTFTGNGLLTTLRYLTSFKKLYPNDTTKTIGFGVTGDLGANHSIVALDLSKPDAPAVLGVMPASDVQRLFVVPNVQNLQTTGDNPCGVGRSFSGDLLITSSYTSVGSAVRFYDVNVPGSPCMLGAKLLTLNPANAVAGQAGVVFTSLGFARTVVALPNAARWTSYTAVENVGVMLVDVGGHIPTVLPANRVREQMIAGNYTDLAAVENTLLAVERTSATLDILDRNLAMLSSTGLPLSEAIAIAYAEAVPVDADRNGQIGQDEIRNLAFVGGVGGVAVVDVTDLGSPFVAGSVPMRGAVFELEFDALKRRLFVAGPSTLPNGDWAVSLIDLSGSDPFGESDYDQNGTDDRILWRTPQGLYGLGNSGYRGLRFDPESRLLYVGTTTSPSGAGGFDIWALDNRCCDLGVDFQARPTSSSGPGDRAQRLQREKRALQIGIARGLAEAQSCGPAIRSAGAAPTPDSVSILEQGSGACLWTANPVDKCTGTYQPGLSDHDYEVFIPEQYFGLDGAPGPQAQCVTQALSLSFIDTIGKPRPIDVDGTPMSFSDITFFPVRRDAFEAAELDILPPRGSSGNDLTGDLGLGRQQLLLKWVLEGEYVDIPGYAVAGKSLESIMTTLRTTTKIKPVEGLEWGTLQKFALVKSTAFVRVIGASVAGTALNRLYIAQLHDAGKAAIRATLARLVADPTARQTVLDTSRAEYGSSACRAFSSTTTPDKWTSKVCTSFEEYVASAAARSMNQANPVFTPDEVTNSIHWFYRVKADVPPTEEAPGIGTEAQADVFIRTASSFIDNVIFQTRPVWEEEIATDPDQQQRRENLQTAIDKTAQKLAATKVVLTPHVFNRGSVAVPQVDVSMFRGTDGPGAKGNSVAVDMAPDSDQYLEDGLDLMPEPQDALTPEDRDLLDLTSLAPSYKDPLFVLGGGGANNPPLDLDGDQGQAQYVAFTIDLPEKKAREADRHNNYGGFWFYLLERDNPAAVPPAVPGAVVPWTTPPAVPLPLPDPGNDLLNPDAECVVQGDLRITHSIILPNGIEQTGVVALDPNQTVTYNVRVHNDTGKAITGVVVCSSLIPEGNNCHPIGPLAPGADGSWQVPYTAPSTGQIIDAVATAKWPEGVRQSAILRILVGCEPEVIVAVEGDPNPTAVDIIGDPNANPPVAPSDASMVMRGGTAFRYYRVVDRHNGIPYIGATVLVTYIYPDGSTLPDVPFTTDSNGRIASPDQPGLGIAIGESLAKGDKVVVKLKSANAVSYCQGEVQFTINVDDRSYTKTWNGGASISAEGAIEVGIAGKAGSGVSMVLAEKAGQSRQGLSFGRTNSIGAGVVEKILETGVESQFGPVKSEAIISASASATLQLAASDRYDFTFPAGSSELGQHESEALGGLLLSTVGDYVGPIVSKILEVAAAQVAPIQPFKASQTVALSLEGKARPRAAITSGFSYSKAQQDLGNVDYGFEANFSSSATIGFALSLEDAIKTKELTPSFEMKGSSDLNVAMANGDVDPNDKKFTPEEKMEVAAVGAVAGSIKGSLTLDAETKAVKKLVLALAGSKKFGWTVDGEQKLIGVDGTTGVPIKTTIKFTVTDPALIAKFLAAVQSLHPLTLQPLSTVATLGLTAINTDIAAFIEELKKSNGIAYEISEERGDAYAFPVSETLSGLGISLGASVGLSLDRFTSFTIEKGVVRNGELFPLATYAKDALIPDLPDKFETNLDEFTQLAKIGFQAIGQFAVAAFDKVTNAFTVAVNRFRSRNTAEMVFSGANEAPFEASVVSFTYTPVPAGAARPFLMRPASVTGPDTVPHYGIGGFHQFQPADHVFADPATVTVFYKDAEVASFNEATLGIYRWNQTRKDWDYLGGVVDAAANTVTTTVDRMGLYTVAPPMPAGSIVLTPQATPAGSPESPRTIATYVSDPVRTNSGQPIADGTMFTVLAAAPSSDLRPFGTILTADEDPQTPGVQVGAHNGVIEFTIDYPVANGTALVVAAAREGTALAATVMPVRP
jgi:PKD repeat protein